MPQQTNVTTTNCGHDTSVDTQSKAMWLSSRTEGNPLYVISGDNQEELKNRPSKPKNVVNNSTYHKHLKRFIQNLSYVNQEKENQNVLVSGEPSLYFALLNPIGSGAFGNLYLAEPIVDDGLSDLKDRNRYFRLKTKEQNIRLSFPFNETTKVVIKKEQINDIKNKFTISGQVRVDSEAHLLSQCVHPNIVSYVGHMIDNDYSYIVMEHLKGRTLKDLIDHHQNIKATINPEHHLSIDVIVSIFTQACLAVEHLHRHRIMHRDLKTANIMIINDDIVKLIDLGFAEQCHGADHAKCLDAVVGTAYYMSPQAVQKKTYNDKTDCWALGVLLYELLELQKPYDAESVGELARKIVTEPYREMKRKVPTEINSLLGALLIKNESTRPNIREVILYLSRAMGGVHTYLEKCRKLSNGNSTNKVSLELLEEQVRMIHKHDYALCPLSSSQQQQHIKAITTEMQQKKIALSQNKIAFSAKLNLFFFNETVERKRMVIESDCELVMHWIDSQVQKTAAIHNASRNAP